MRGHIFQRSEGSWTIVLDIGRKVDPATGKRATVVGRLAGFAEAAGEVDLSEIESKPDMRLRLQDIQLAKLVIDE